MRDGSAQRRDRRHLIPDPGVGLLKDRAKRDAVLAVNGGLVMMYKWTMTESARDQVRDDPLVGIIILNWNDGPRTIACAESVLSSTYRRFFVVLVDNGSKDGSRDMISRWVEDHAALPLPEPEVSFEAEAPRSRRRRFYPPFLSMLRLGTNRGYGAGNNAGIAHAIRVGAEAVWVLNNDTTVDPGALAEVARVLKRNHGVGLVGSCVINDDGLGLVQCLGGGTYGRWTSRTQLASAGLDPRYVSPQVAIDFISGCAILLSTECIEQVGGFEEGFFLYCEEVDLARRAAAAGWGMAVAERAIVRHVHGASAGSNADITQRSARSFFYSARSAVLLARKSDRLTLPFVVVARIAFAIMLSTRGKRVASRAVLMGVGSGLSARAWSSTPSLAKVLSLHR